MKTDGLITFSNTNKKDRLYMSRDRIAACLPPPDMFFLM